MNEDAELLRHYAENRSEAAFAEFVRRRVDFVYGCALRRVGGDAHFADDVTQQVFVAVARDARRLASHPVLAGWLYTTSRNVAVQLVRAERRRLAREQEAHAMDQSDEQPGLNWEQIRPVLDEALDALDEADRQAVLLRYFEGKSFAEVGTRLRLAENAARMRVNRALDKMSATLSRHGVTSTASALAVALAGQPGIAAPAGLAATATGAALAGSAAGSGSAAVVFMGMTKLQLGVAAAVIAAGSVGFVAQSREASAIRRDFARIESKLAEVPAFVVEAEALARAQRTAAEQERLAAAEIAQLRQETAVLNAKIGERKTARVAVASGRSARAPYVGETLDLSLLDTPPAAVSRSAPKYPFDLRRVGATGEAMIDFVVDPDGAVRNSTTLQATHREIAEAALAAVEDWKFKPGLKAGRPVATHMQVPIVFTLSPDEGAATTPPDTNTPWF